MRTNFKINGVTVKSPSDFKIERYKITEAERLASGLMTMDLIAKKRKFLFTYEAITAADANKILDIIWDSSSVFYTLSYVENNVTKSAEVYVGAIPATLHRTDNSNWVWKDFTFNLIER